MNQTDGMRSQMRVVGEQRGPGLAELGRDDPVVGTDLVVAGEPGAAVEAGQVEDPAAGRGDVAPRGVLGGSRARRAAVDSGADAA